MHSGSRGEKNLPDKGTPVVRRVRKAAGQVRNLTAGLPKEGDEASPGNKVVFRRNGDRHDFEGELCSRSPPVRCQRHHCSSARGDGVSARLAGAQTPACGTVTDSLSRVLPTLSMRPATGQSYVDPVFGCTITRLTDATAEGVASVGHFYSSVNPFNTDSTLVLLQKAAGFQHI